MASVGADEKHDLTRESEIAPGQAAAGGADEPNHAITDATAPDVHHADAYDHTDPL